MEDKPLWASSAAEIWTSEFRLQETQKADVAAMTQASSRDTFELGEQIFCIFMAL